MLRTPQPKLTMDDALAIMHYHIEMNRITQRSHTKTWWLRHPKVKPKAPLQNQGIVTESAFRVPIGFVRTEHSDSLSRSGLG